MTKIEKLLLILTYFLAGELMVYRPLALSLIACWLTLRFTGLILLALTRLFLKLIVRLWTSKIEIVAWVRQAFQ